jgi:hypothetical protein
MFIIKKFNPLDWATLILPCEIIAYTVAIKFHMISVHLQNIVGYRSMILIINPCCNCHKPRESIQLEVVPCIQRLVG